ncbi:MAG: hypothetical protein HQK83_10015 [Fibrobacteria bacterium]|nr:hypothetical protein [Fibrobacteria bacterium]
MDAQNITRNLSKIIIHSIVLTVIGFSLYLTDEISLNAIIFILFKGLIAYIFFWIIFLILTDSLVKSMMISVADLQEKRKDGGLLYHLIKPADNEIIVKEIKKMRKKKKK